MMRKVLLDAGKTAGVSMIDGGVYGVTQGPRLETAAEIKRMSAEGCTIVGMTAMPEAALARELEMGYASCAVVVNPAAGVDGKAIDSAQLQSAVPAGMEKARSLIATALPSLAGK